MSDCPINLKCEDYEKDQLFGLSCINSRHCFEWSKPWPLPFRRSYGVLEVVLHKNNHLPRQYYEGVKESGWEEAVMLPFRYLLWEEEWLPYSERFENDTSQGLPFPVLIVDFYTNDDEMENKYNETELTEIREHGWEMSVNVDNDEF